MSAPTGPMLVVELDGAAQSIRFITKTAEREARSWRETVESIDYDLPNPREIKSEPVLLQEFLQDRYSPHGNLVFEMLQACERLPSEVTLTINLLDETTNLLDRQRMPIDGSTVRRTLRLTDRTSRLQFGLRLQGAGRLAPLRLKAAFAPDEAKPGAGVSTAGGPVRAAEKPPVRGGDPDEARPIDRWLRKRIRDHGKQVLKSVAPLIGSHEVDAVADAQGFVDLAVLEDARNVARQAASQAAFFRDLVGGRSLVETAVATARALVESKNPNDARSLAYGLLREGGSPVAGALSLAVVASTRGLHPMVFDLLSDLPREFVRRHVPIEFLNALYRFDKALATAELAALRNGWKDLDAATRLGVARIAYAHGDVEPAREIMAALLRDPATPAQLSDADMSALRWFADYAASLDAENRSRDSQPGAARPRLAIIDYKQPNYAKMSANLGDYVQTLAFLGNVVRHANTRFVSSDQRLADHVEGLRARLNPDRALSGTEREVELVRVNRDASHDQTIPPSTWMIAFGWYMHPQFDEAFDFPFHDNIRPLFISFHINNTQFLTDEAIAYLKKYGPVGCRDWSTVYTLLSHNVPAFFTGCLTTTIDNLYERPATPAVGGTAFVDVRPDPDQGSPEPHEFIRQSTDDVRWADLVANLEKADRRLKDYREKFSQIVTNRLHCYLPTRSLGLDVLFQPKDPADVRFDGLIGLDQAGFEDMKAGLLAKVSKLIDAVMSGADESSVYAAMREIYADEIAEAAEKFSSVASLTRSDIDLDAVCRSIRTLERRYGSSSQDTPRLDVCFATDERLKDVLPVTLESALRNTSSPLRVWVLSRGLASGDFDTLARDFPEVEWRFLPCDDAVFDIPSGLLRHTTMSTMDRLLLPSLLPEIERILYVDIDTVVTGDVRELFELDLRGAPIGAASSIWPVAAKGRYNIERAAARLPSDLAAELRLRMNARFPLDFAAFNAGVLVLDLAMMRRDDFCAQFMPYVGRYQMNDQEVLNCYAGPSRTQLPPGWNQFPSQQVLKGSKLIHWTGRIKPWRPEYLPGKEIWEFYRDSAKARKSR